MRRQYQTVVVGAGPAGITAALFCARENQNVLLVDRMDRIGKKILVTGNGKCNMTNLSQNPACYRSEAPGTAWSIFSDFNEENAITFFHQLGIHTKDRDGYVYPYNEQAACVREAMEQALMQYPCVQVLSEVSVQAVMVEEARRRQSAMPPGKQKSPKQCIPERKYRIETTKGTFFAENVIIATGGFAGVRLGCEGDGYRIAQDFGVSVVKPLPALTALRSGAPFLKKISGVRCRGSICLIIDGEAVAKETGELQWTDYGISGVAVFQVSRFAVRALEEGRKVKANIDFMPDMDIDKLCQLLRDFQKTNGYKNGNAFLQGILPSKLVPVVLREVGIAPAQQVCDWEEEIIHDLAKTLKEFSLRISGYMGYEKAQVTQGGVDLRELTEHLEAKSFPGLFFAGEVLDVDGTCGGYNLQWAFSSGHKAGMAACTRSKILHKNGNETDRGRDQ